MKVYDLDEYQLTSTSFHYLYISVWPFDLLGKKSRQWGSKLIEFRAHISSARSINTIYKLQEKFNDQGYNQKPYIEEQTIKWPKEQT